MNRREQLRSLPVKYNFATSLPYIVQYNNLPFYFSHEHFDVRIEFANCKLMLLQNLVSCQADKIFATWE